MSTKTRTRSQGLAHKLTVQRGVALFLFKMPFINAQNDGHFRTIAVNAQAIHISTPITNLKKCPLAVSGGKSRQKLRRFVMYIRFKVSTVQV